MLNMKGGDCYRHWHDLAAKKKEEAQKQILIIDFLRK
jgi:acyl-CoA-binding protein